MMKTMGAFCMGLALIASASCSSMTQTGKGALIGGGGGAALGAGLGAIIGGGKGAGIGSAIGAAVGAGAGALIGNKMDKQQKELEKIQGAEVQQTTDQNGLQAIKVTFNGGILFPTGKSTISPSAQTALDQFAQSLISNPDTNVQIYGFTDNTGSMAVNERVANERAASVLSYLANCGVPYTRLSSQGIPMADYVASNDTPAGRAQNRRVEIYITADQNMIKKAEAGTLQ